MCLARISHSKATRSPPAKPACSVRGLRCAGEALVRVIALWGITPALLVSLFTCLLSSASLSVGLFVSPCCGGRQASWCLSCCDVSERGFEALARDKFTHSS